MSYPVVSGKTDFIRMSILNSIYNPSSFAFIEKFGIDKAMSVLEIGCGYGSTAIWLAKKVGYKGRVLAIDQDCRQIKFSINRSKGLNLTNLSFTQASLEDLFPRFLDSFDFIYIRWTLMFINQPLNWLRLIYQLLKSGGSLVCEDISVISNGIFTCPKSDIGERWTKMMKNNFQALNLDLDLAGSLYSMFMQAGFDSLDAEIYQPLLKTKKEKSICRLGIACTKYSILENNSVTPEEFEGLVKDLKGYENCTKSIIGYVRTFMISGKKQ